MENTTKVTHFILVGLTNSADLQIPLFVLFTLIYLITLTGNLGMMVLIMLDSRLHTPMYFFLSNLSFVDLCYSTTITPKVIAGFLIQDKVISYNACAAQLFFFVALATVENLLLASMAYDRYAAVCKPLHYTTTMTTSMSFTTVENLLLASMAYDHYAAVYRRLHCATTLRTNVCTVLAIKYFVRKCIKEWQAVVPQ
ncbi:olfactory receptor 5B2-like [Tupaia chinensis]|uniref:olfactory receptor 5B2-like n=1 Tax=Tupaia chinensis TaxID=246437 RepID=UPI0003C8E0F1|nr:olfactory receptor 5B2-like [Tupaia chinensis]